MRCPKCGNLEDRVIDSRESKDGLSVRRRRECSECNYRYTTYEQVEVDTLSVIKRNESRQLWDRNKLIESMNKACGKLSVGIETLERAADDILLHLQQEGCREVPARLVGDLVMQKLENISHIAYVRYASIYREFKDVGEFINEIHSLGTRHSCSAAEKSVE